MCASEWAERDTDRRPVSMNGHTFEPDLGMVAVEPCCFPFGNLALIFIVAIRRYEFFLANLSMRFRNCTTGTGGRQGVGAVQVVSFMSVLQTTCHFLCWKKRQKEQGKMAGKYFLQQREVSSEFQRFRWTEDQQRVFRQKKVEMTGKLEAGQLFHCTFRCSGGSIWKWGAQNSRDISWSYMIILIVKIVVLGGAVCTGPPSCAAWRTCLLLVWPVHNNVRQSLWMLADILLIIMYWTFVNSVYLLSSVSCNEYYLWFIYIYIYIWVTEKKKNTNLVLLCLGLSEVAQNLHNRSGTTLYRYPICDTSWNTEILTPDRGHGIKFKM